MHVHLTKTTNITKQNAHVYLSLIISYSNYKLTNY